MNKTQFLTIYSCCQLKLHETAWLQPPTYATVRPLVVLHRSGKSLWLRRKSSKVDSEHCEFQRVTPVLIERSFLNASQMNYE